MSGEERDLLYDLLERVKKLEKAAGKKKEKAEE